MNIRITDVPDMDLASAMPRLLANNVAALLRGIGREVSILTAPDSLRFIVRIGDRCYVRIDLGIEE